MNYHEIANALPMMTDGEIAELAEDIKRNGLIHPIVLFEDQILDGRNRYQACELLGLQPKFTDYTGSNPWRYVWSENGNRRHLPAGQKAALTLRFMKASDEYDRQQQEIRDKANERRSEATKSQPRTEDGKKLASGRLQPCKTPDKENHAHEKLAKASSTSARTAATVLAVEKERPDLFEKVCAGELSIEAAARQKKKDEVSENIEELPDDKYRIIYADPPWKYNDKCDSGGVQSGGAEKHYPTMSIPDLCAMPVADMVTDNAVLFMWTTSPLLQDSFKVIEAWGFKYKASFVWDKVRHNMGHYNSVRHEFLLIGTRGSCTPDNVKLFDSVQSIEKTKKHSEKPEEFRYIIDTLYTYGKKIELFARKQVPNWEAWGGESA